MAYLASNRVPLPRDAWGRDAPLRRSIHRTRRRADCLWTDRRNRSSLPALSQPHHGNCADMVVTPLPKKFNRRLVGPT